jgi:hypothetical protein
MQETSRRLLMPLPTSRPESEQPACALAFPTPQKGNSFSSIDRSTFMASGVLESVHQLGEQKSLSQIPAVGHSAERSERSSLGKRSP